MKIKLPFIFLAFFFLSCQKEKTKFSLEANPQKFNIAEAKNYYDDELIILKQIQMNEKKQNLKIDYKVDWETYKNYIVNDSTEIMTIRLGSYSKTILGNYGKSFLLLKKTKKKIIGNIVNVLSNLNGHDYFGSFDLNGNFLSGLKTKNNKFDSTFDYQLANNSLKVMSIEQSIKVNGCYTASISVELNGRWFSHIEYHCTPDDPNTFLSMPSSGGGSLGNMLGYADYLNSMTDNLGYDIYSGENELDFDNNSDWTGAMDYILESIILPNGKFIKITFGITKSDNKSANNQISVKLLDALKSLLNEVSNNSSLSSIHLSATTNGKHASTSNHYKGLAIDISKINGTPVINLGPNNILVSLMQNAFENIAGRRENFGPSFTKKLGYPHDPGISHEDHILFSVDGN